MLTEMMRDILTTRPDEIGCVECFDQLDRYVDARMSGLNAAQAMPLVRTHLDHCPDCREESDALLIALRNL
jgi:hypothetical protein